MSEPGHPRGDGQNLRDQARKLALALDAIEQRLAALGPKSDPDTIAEALAEPVRAFDLAAKES